MGVVKFVDFFVPLEETIDGQKGGSASELDLPGDGIGGAPGLHGVEQIAGEDRLMLAAMQTQRRAASCISWQGKPASESFVLTLPPGRQSNRSAERRIGNWKMALRDQHPKPAPQ